MSAALRVACSASAIAAALLLAPTPARACNCAPPPAPAIALANSDAVFTGVARARRRVVAPSGVGMLLVQLEVDQRWKGEVAALQEVATPEGDGPCEFPMAIGTRYLLYARRLPDLDVFFVDQRSLSVSLCSRSHLAAEAAEDFGVLGAGLPPLPAPPPPDASRSDAAAPAPRPAVSCAYAAGGAPGTAALTLLTLLLALRRRRR